MNSFQTSCCRSHPLLRPGVGNRAPDVFVPVVEVVVVYVVGGGGGGGEREDEGGWRLGQGVCSAPSRTLRMGRGCPARLVDEEVIWD